MKEKVETLKTEVLEKVANTTSLKEINDLKVEYLGKKGPIQELSSHMRDLDAEGKKEFGMLLNGLKQDVTNAIDTSCRYSCASTSTTGKCLTASSFPYSHSDCAV